MSSDQKAFDYDAGIARMKHSGNEAMQRHFFLGTWFRTGEPGLVAGKILEEHIWVLGSSGSGKGRSGDHEGSQM